MLVPRKTQYALRAVFELAKHSGILAEKKEIIVLNKTDLDPEGERIEDISGRLGSDGVMAISAVTGEGVGKLNERLWTMIKGQAE